MSDFLDMASDDLESLIDENSDLGQAAVYRSAEGTEVDIRITVGDMADGIQVIFEGSTSNRTVPATTRLSTIVDAIGRNPLERDRVIFATGAMTAEWSVVGVQPDDADGVQLALRHERYLSAGKVGKS